MPANGQTLPVTSAACRRISPAPLPLIFDKRIDDVFSDKLARVGRTLDVSAADAAALVAIGRSLVCFLNRPLDDQSQMRIRLEGVWFKLRADEDAAVVRPKREVDPEGGQVERR